ncbi:MAG: nickel-responsive transcriptional regulator NikR [Candidatus Cloacimonetes bacterium]|jgi:CopG family nickel-responsive transcriptional regulator|nr:nickel-responsive transcriptional regulator NikR [Candidatus Cloacimonadota bacterium]MBT4331997.1 nickel-responsive transcriptional regulator NikR [Candidatus Cloacimonadota bacterium]MBT4576607.1 nickel-responsive transcriptional regulator NikR [Candidatus Cloacimonadota bacterium]MBT5420574.1 nickel-responsive transcriptional regulator NikR [Candidatus Cloacimonadota bacterium]
MSDLIRFGVSIEKELLEKYDAKIKLENYSNRSNAIADLIRENLIKQEWQEDKIITGVITIVFDHHKRDLVNNLTNIQHNHHDLIISSQHIHLDHDYCFEIVVVKGKPKELKNLCTKIKAAKGVKHSNLNLATTGEI